MKNYNLKRIISMATALILALAVFISEAPLTTAMAGKVGNGPYGAEEFTYEDYLVAMEGYESNGVLDREEWKRLVALTYEKKVEIVRDTQSWMGYNMIEMYEYNELRLILEKNPPKPDGPGISGSFYCKGDPGLEDWFEFSDDFTGVQYSGVNWFRLTYEINGNIINVKRGNFDEKDSIEIVILDENRLQYELTSIIGPEIYIRMEGVEDNLPRRRPDEEYMDFWARISYDEQMEILRQGWYMYGTPESVKEKANAEAAAAALAAKPITLKVNGRVIATDSPPVVENGRTLAPVRAVVEALGYIVSYDSGTQVIDIYDLETHDLRITLKIGSNRARVSTGIYGVTDERILDVPAKTINGRTMAPVRFIAETLGCSVGWDETTKTVSIVQNAG